MSQTLAKHGLSYGSTPHASTPFDGSEFDERTLILVMEQEWRDRILKDWPDAINLHILGDYVGMPGDIKDPYGGTEEDYEQCYDRLRGMLLTLVEMIKEGI